MPTEQRVISSKPKSGTISAGSGKVGSHKMGEAEAEPKAKRSRKGLVIVLAGLLVVALAAVGFLLLQPKSGTAAAPKPAPSPGDVVKVDSMTVNLADGRFLRIGFAMQMSTETKVKPDTAFAADQAIALWSGHTEQDVTNPTTRDQLKADLLKTLAARYGDRAVIGVYLTEYVTQ